MVVGHGGMFQFHHGVFYGVGAYAVALMLTKTSMPMWIGFIAGPIVAAITGSDHWLVLCQADQALLWHAPDFFGFTDLGHRFSLV